MTYLEKLLTPSPRVPIRTFLAVMVAGLLAVSSSVAADWPTWRGDAGRRGATTEPLPNQLKLAWTRQLAVPRPAWPDSQPMLRFDEILHPIAAGGRVLVSSPNDDSVTAYDTKTGKQIWKTFTEGPVRFAPAVDDGRVFVTSDDGALYCLNLDDGQIQWKFNGAPIHRRVLGNDRMVSTWSCRTGPVVADGVVYFTAGIWPSMGVFVHAIDAKTGKAVWTNSKTGSLYTVHPHGAPAFGSVVPQGYLAVAGDYLVVPGGRTMPAVFDRQTGEMLHFEFGPKNGGNWWAAADGDSYFFEGTRLSLKDGKKVESMAEGVIQDGKLISVQSDQLVIQSLKGKERQKYSLPTKSPKWVAMVAGSHAYTVDGNRIVRFPIPDSDRSAPKELSADFTVTLDSNIGELFAADDRLFAITDDARLHCFALTKQATAHHREQFQAIERPEDGWQQRVESILATVKEPQGYALCLGAGRPAEELVLQSHLHVLVLEPDATVAEAFRRRMDRAGFDGERVSVIVSELDAAKFPPYWANLVVAQSAPQNLKLLFEVVRPYGGVAWIECDEAAHQRIVKNPSKEASISREKGWTVLAREGALPRSGQWSHQYGDAGNTGISKDDLVKAPLGLLWFGGPPNDEVLPRHGHGPTPQVAGGRLVIEGPDMLRAVDVYTGRVLWEREMPGLGQYYDTTRHFAGAGEVGSNYVTLPDRVYVVYKKDILELDAATGETRRKFHLGGDDPDSNWGFLSATDDYLVATSNPVKLEVLPPETAKGKIPKGFTPVIKANETWQYLNQSDPPKGWAEPGFKANWSEGIAGFGYDGPGPDLPKGMKGTAFPNKNDGFTRMYIRKEFDAKRLDGITELGLMVNYDDGFVAYLNGKEVARSCVEDKPDGKVDIRSHDAKGHEFFLIENFKKHLRPGTNVLAFVGHNISPNSSDFWLDPYVVANKGKPVFPTVDESTPANKSDVLKRWLKPADYAPASRQLVAFDRKTGEILWTREAAYEFRHNTIVIGFGKIFCIDGVSPRKLQVLVNSGLPAEGHGQLLALDAQTGDVLWSTKEDVFGTFLNYSEEHDVLLQAGSAYRDRAWDEVDRGMVVYRGRDGEVLWKDLDLRYNGPCLIRRDSIITNGTSGFELGLFDGKPSGWKFKRMYGCNTIIGSEHLLTFRSGAAGFCDMDGGGTGNLGGFRSGCTSNLIIADGVFSAPDYTRTCTCAYQNQCSLAFIHMPDAEVWTFGAPEIPKNGPTRLGVNLGAPGDRLDDAGTLWLDYPSVGGPSPEIDVKVEGDVSWFRKHSVYMNGDGVRWIGASGGKGIRSISVKVDDADPKKQYTVRLHFSEPEKLGVGERVFDIALQGQKVMNAFDVVEEAGGTDRAIVREFRDVRIKSDLKVELMPTQSNIEPILSGVEIVEQR